MSTARRTGTGRKRSPKVAAREHRKSRSSVRVTQPDRLRAVGIVASVAGVAALETSSLHGPVALAGTMLLGAGVALFDGVGRRRLGLRQLGLFLGIVGAVLGAWTVLTVVLLRMVDQRPDTELYVILGMAVAGGLGGIQLLRMEQELGEEAAAADPTSPRRVLTIPNALSAIRILLIPVFIALLLDEDTRLAGFLLMAAVVATDWLDGVVARRTGQVTELGKLLDPLADRLALGAALVTFVILDLLPLWAALLVLVRDGIVLLAAAWLLLTRGPRIQVRPIGKYATFTLMWAIPAIAWGNAGLLIDDVLLVFGWVWFPVGTIEYYAAGVAYARDLRAALRARRSERSPDPR